uniref:Uncharacterized protein n=1 Tax=Rhizophora mucronata TaxID=61149 RepID=A0A2P2QGT0_RHIMU
MCCNLCINSKEYLLTGCCIILKKLSLVVTSF